MSQITTAEFVIPTAMAQTSLAADEILHSGNCGVIVERVAQLHGHFKSEGRMFARELSEYINTHYAGIATVFVYEDTFGTKDRLHWLIHLRSLYDYERMIGMGTADDGWRDIIMRDRIPAAKGGGSSERLFTDGSLRETVLLPQNMGMYGTFADQVPESLMAEEDGTVRLAVPSAQHQSPLPPEKTLNSATCGIMMHRVGETQYLFRNEARQFCRAIAEKWTRDLEGLASVFFYEEAFGRSDQVHWLIHLKNLGVYYDLMGHRARIDAEAREIFTRQWIPADKGGGGWERLFVQGSLADTALTPQHWGMFATRRLADPS